MHCEAPYPLTCLLRNLDSSESGPNADHSNTQMAPRKGQKKAAGPAKTPRTITRSAGMEVKFNRIGELKVKFAGVTKALRPALAEMEGRTSQQSGHPAYQTDGHRKAQYDAFVVELEKVGELSIARRVAYHETHRELKAVSVQHETRQEVTTIENQYMVVDLSWIIRADIRLIVTNRKRLKRSVKAASPT